MQKLLIAITIALLFQNCTDNSCKTCTTDVTTITTGVSPVKSQVTQTLCGDDIDRVNGKTTSTTATSGNTTIKTISITNCK